MFFRVIWLRLVNFPRSRRPLSGWWRQLTSQFPSVSHMLLVSVFTLLPGLWGQIFIGTLLVRSVVFRLIKVRRFWSRRGRILLIRLILTRKVFRFRRTCVPVLTFLLAGSDCIFIVILFIMVKLIFRVVILIGRTFAS